MSDPIVTIDQGQLRGSIEVDVENNEYYSFLGIPFAKPPVGALRFKDPEKPESWKGIRDATTEGDSCYAVQPSFGSNDLTFEYGGSEDCLYLNVSTRSLGAAPKQAKISKAGARPVMVFVPGGGFVMGGGSVRQYGPKFLLTRDIVLVSFNYRTGSLGFLSLESQSVGNAGLKDQVAALKWVQNNIEHFGGDPNNVTVFGESAGAASAHYLVISPLTKGLFKRAIVQSGAAIHPWSNGKQNNAIDLAQAFDFTETDQAKILQFLQSIPVEDLVKTQMEKIGDSFDASRVKTFAPTIERPSPNSFISEAPADILLAGNLNHVPLILGYNSQESIFFAEVPGIQELWPVNFQNFVPNYVDGGTNPELNKKIINYYFGQDDVDLTDKAAVYQVLSDVNFVRGAITAVRNHARKSPHPVYLYRFSAETKLNRNKAASGVTLPGVPHGDDNNYLFRNTLEPVLEPGTPEWIGRERMVTMWTNFAKTGKPIPEQDDLLDVEWTPVEVEQLNFLDIGNELVAGTDPDSERVQFWDQVYGDLADKY